MPHMPCSMTPLFTLEACKRLVNFGLHMEQTENEGRGASSMRAPSLRCDTFCWLLPDPLLVAACKGGTP